ncbi:MAG: FAD:protein FMN transferase [Betaproteobacteria bacterium]
MDTLLSPRRRTVLQALGAAALVAACGDRRDAASAPVAEFRGPTMGSSYTVKIAGADLSTAALAAAHDAARTALAAVDAAMSTHRRDSELSRFNRHPARTPFAFSPDTFAVFALAERVSAATGGAFDVTVGPVVDAWGFGPGREFRVVDGAEVDALERRVGWNMLALDGSARTVAKARPDLAADLSGIAKGHGVDRAAQALDALGIERYMVEAGGEVRTRGINGDGQPWQIGIEQPDAMPPRPRHVVPLVGRAMATSGDYRVYFERDGRRYCHEIDPATGRPIANGVASVTVVAPECGYADAMATALMVLGPERGLALATAQDIAALFVVRAPGGALVDLMTPAFAALGGRAIVQA